MEELTLHLDGATATISINRPQRRNAMTHAMWVELHRLCESIDDNDAIRVVIVRGGGNEAFAAGSDIAELPEVYADPATAANYDRTMLNAQKRLAACQVPTIALVHGPCFGGGLGIATACDLRFADAAASFCVPPARLGVIYGVSATKRLIDLVGPSMTKDLLFSARVLSAAEAWHLGLVDRVYDTASLADEAYAYANTLTQNSSHSQRETKRFIRNILDGHGEDSEGYYKAVSMSVAGPDFAEGFDAFMNKRRPRFNR